MFVIHSLHSMHHTLTRESVIPRFSAATIDWQRFKIQYLPLDCWRLESGCWKLDDAVLLDTVLLLLAELNLAADWEWLGYTWTRVTFFSILSSSVVTVNEAQRGPWCCLWPLPAHTCQSKLAWERWLILLEKHFLQIHDCSQQRNDKIRFSSDFTIVMFMRVWFKKNWGCDCWVCFDPVTAWGSGMLLFAW